MVQGVYVDILLCTNFFVHILLLSLLSAICHRSSEHRWRSILAAVIGSCFSLSIFLPPLPHFWEVAIKLLSAVIMLRIAFEWKGWVSFLKECLILFLITNLFYGILISLQKIYTIAGMFVFDNAIYFHIRVPVFIICLTCAYSVVWIVNRILSSRASTHELYMLELTIQEKSKKLTGLLDTGNQLTEPFSGLPVIVCGIDLAAVLLSSDLLEAVLGVENEESCHVRQIPFSAISGSGFLPAVKGKRIYLENKDQKFLSQEFYVAFSHEKIGDGDWQVLLHKKLLCPVFDLSKEQHEKIL